MFLLQLLFLPALMLLQSSQRIGGTWLGVVIPAALLILSFGITWLLYKHFSQRV